MRMNRVKRLAGWIYREEQRKTWRLAPYPGWWRAALQLLLLSGLLWTLAHSVPALVGLRSLPRLLSIVLAMRIVLEVQAGAQAARQDLLGRPTLPLVHMAPLRPGDWLLAHLLAAAPGAVAGSAYGVILVAGLAPGSLALRLGLLAPLVTLALVLLALLGRGLGTLSVLWWVRRWPRGVTVLVFGVTLLQIGSGLWILGRTVQGQDAGQARLLALVVPTLLLSLPGVGLLAQRLLGRISLGQRYHQAWIILRQYASQGGPRVSRDWRYLHRTGAGGLIARDWLALWRNPLGMVRIVAALVAAGSAVPFGWWLGPRAGAPGLLLGVGALLWFLLAVEWIGAVLTGEGPALTWYRLTPVAPARLLWGKWLSTVCPPALVVGLVAGLAAVAAGLVWTAALGVVGACLGAGTVLLGLAACTPAAAGGGFGGDDGRLSAFLGEQLPRSSGALVGVALATGYLALAIWGGRAPWTWSLLLTVPLAALLLGSWRLRRTWQPRLSTR